MASTSPNPVPTNRARLWVQSFEEAEQRKSDSSLPIDVRIRSAETCALLLKAADERGHSYGSLKALALAR